MITVVPCPGVLSRRNGPMHGMYHQAHVGQSKTEAFHVVQVPGRYP